MIARLALALSLAVLAQPASAATFGLIVGINDYEAEADLDGAVEDGRDIARALGEFGAQRVLTLFDRQATKAAIAAGYDALLAEAQAGDTLIFSYAGHGAQSPAKVPAEEADGMDEFFLLSSFDRTRPETLGEMVLDDEVRAWMERAEDKQVKVILVADSCHSGGMLRAVQAKFRFAQPVQMPLGMDSPDAVAGAEITEDQLPSAMFFSASLESQLTPEIHIDGTPRGALSYAFSRALEGNADDNKDGRISKAELESYVVGTVENYAEMLQTPVIRPRSVTLSDETVFDLTRSLAVEPVPEQAKQEPQPEPKPEPQPDPVPKVAQIPTIPFSVVNGSPVAVQGTTPGNDSGYRWDASTLQFFSPLGDVAGNCVRPEMLQRVVDKFRLVELLRHEAVSRTGSISIAPQKGLYVANDQITLGAPDWPDATAVVFNLANTGEVQFLAESKGTGQGSIDIGSTRVVEPFGADHLIVMSLKTKTPNLGLFLKRRPAPTTSDLLAALPQLLKGEDARIAIQSLYTAGAPQRMSAAGGLQAQEATSCS